MGTSPHAVSGICAGREGSMILLNAISANMLAEFPCSLSMSEISAQEARIALLCAAEADGEADLIRSAVGHADTAAIFSAALGVPVPCQRETVTLRIGDAAIVGQYIGPRLPEGCRQLPAGASIRWLYVSVTDGEFDRRFPPLPPWEDELASNICDTCGKGAEIEQHTKLLTSKWRCTEVIDPSWAGGRDPNRPRCLRSEEGRRVAWDGEEVPALVCPPAPAIRPLGAQGVVPEGLHRLAQPLGPRLQRAREISCFDLYAAFVDDMIILALLASAVSLVMWMS